MYSYQLDLMWQFIFKSSQIAKLISRTELQHCFRNSSSNLSPSSWHWGSMVMHALENNGSWGHSFTMALDIKSKSKKLQNCGKGTNCDDGYSTSSRLFEVQFPRVQMCPFQCFRMWSWCIVKIMCICFPSSKPMTSMNVWSRSVASRMSSEHVVRAKHLPDGIVSSQ